MNEVLDPAIIEGLPPGCDIISLGRHGNSSWASTFKMTVEANGEEQRYFLKILQRDRHAEMAQGEYESQMAMWHHIPDNVVVPVAHGTFKNDDSKSFYLALLRHFKDEIPGPEPLVHVLKALQTSGISPNGKFGFHVPTFNGYVPLINDWCDTWEEWFSRQLRSDMEWEQSIRGRDDHLNKIADEFFEKVIPRLLRPLETGGRSIRPVLIHGDLWHENAGVDGVTGKVILFDSCCCYGHSEMELFMMRHPRYVFSEDYINHYKQSVGMSEPIADFDNRNALYAMRDNLLNSGLHPDRGYLRQAVKEDMQRLLEKYPNGIDDFVEVPPRAALDKLPHPIRPAIGSSL